MGLPRIIPSPRVHKTVRSHPIGEDVPRHGKDGDKSGSGQSLTIDEEPGIGDGTRRRSKASMSDQKPVYPWSGLTSLPSTANRQHDSQLRFFVEHAPAHCCGYNRQRFERGPPSPHRAWQERPARTGQRAPPLLRQEPRMTATLLLPWPQRSSQLMVA